MSRITAVVLALCCACAEGANPTGPGDFVVALPESPAPPMLADWACPTGWLSQPAFDAVVDSIEPHQICVPPEPPATCMNGMAAFLGETACQPIGVACPTSDWPEDLPSGTSIVYVQPGGTGDGSTPATPLGTLADAYAAAPDRALLALSKGTFTENIVLERGVSLRGTCAGETVIAAPGASDEEAVVVVRGDGGSAVENVTITGSQIGLVLATASEAVRVSGVWLRGTRGIALLASGEVSVELEDLLITDTEPLSDNQGGFGLYAQWGAQVTAERVTVERTRFASVFVHDEQQHVGQTRTWVQARELLVRDTAEQISDGLHGHGVMVALGAHGTFERVLVERNVAGGVTAEHDTLVELRDVHVRDTGGPKRVGSSGVTGRIDAKVTGERLVLERNRDGLVSLEGSDIRVSDLVVRDGHDGGSAASYVGGGVRVAGGARAEVDGVVVESCTGVGMHAAGTSAELVVRDSLVIGTQLNTAGVGYGLGADEGGVLEVQRLVVAGSDEAGAIVSGGDATLVDVRIVDTQPRDPSSEFGYGISLQPHESSPSPTSATLERVVVENSAVVGIGVFDGSTLIGTDVRVRTTTSGGGFDMLEWGEGIEVIDATAQLVRVAVESNRHFGVVVRGARATADLRDVTVHETAPAECDGRCLAGSGGTGLSVIDGSLRVINFELRGNDLAGLQVVGILAVPELLAHRGRVHDNLIGMHVGTDPFDYDNALIDVSFADNEVELSAEVLPVGEPPPVVSN